MKLTKCRLGDYIRDVASGPFGSNLKVENFVPAGFPIIDGANLTKLRVTDNITKFVTEKKARSLSRSIARRHDVIVTISGTLGQVSFIPDNSKYEEYLCSQRQFRVTFDESKICVEYLVNLLRTPYGQRKILAFANYVGVPALSQPIPNFKNIELLLPDLQNQLLIAGILGSLDEKIEVNRRKIAELEALAKTIFEYWFVQFDFPDANGRPYKTSGGKMVWNEQLKYEIPVGWTVSPFASIIDNIKNGEWGKESRENKSDIQIQCLRGTDFIAAKSSPELSPPIRFIEEKQKEKILREFDLIIEVSGGSPTQSTGRIMYVNNAFLDRMLFPVCCSNFCKAISVTDQNLFYWAYFVWDRHYEQGTFFRFEGKTSGIKNLQFDSVCGSIINPIPPAVVSSQFTDIIAPIYTQIQNLIKESKLYFTVRDTILPLLMNGQVEVK